MLAALEPTAHGMRLYDLDERADGGSQTVVELLAADLPKIAAALATAHVEDPRQCRLF